jgi:hypothetical protein
LRNAHPRQGGSGDEQRRSAQRQRLEERLGAAEKGTASTSGASAVAIRRCSAGSGSTTYRAIFTGGHPHSMRPARSCA